MKKIALIAMLVLVALVIYGCSGGDGTVKDAEAPANTGTEDTAPAAPTEGGDGGADTAAPPALPEDAAGGE